MGTLVIYNFNITQKELLTLHDQIDYTFEDPLTKASKTSSPIEIFNAVPKWTVSDVIVVVLAIPTILKPIACVLKYDNLNIIEPDEKFIAHATTIEDENKFFDLDKYDEIKEPFIKTVGIDFKVFNSKEFKILTSDQIYISTFNITKKEFFITKTKLNNSNNSNNQNEPNEPNELKNASNTDYFSLDYLIPNNLFKKNPKWNKTDIIVNIIEVSLRSKPKGHVVSCEVSDKLIRDQSYSVLINNYSSSDNIFESNYDPKNDSHTLEFNVCNINDSVNLTSHNSNDFELIYYECF